MRRPRAMAPWLAPVVAASFVAACISDRAGVVAPGDDVECVVPLNAFGPDRAVVLIREFAFVPDTLVVHVGTTVTWVNCEPPAREGHTATAVNGSWGSALLPAGGSYARRFDTLGAAPYLCLPHPHMTGVIIVQ
jgi:plastocyanin